MKQSFVSIVIPSYNSVAFVCEAVDSALAQTYKNREIIVVDDGSTDDTKSVLEPYIKSGKIKYIYQQNGGLSAARNTGIKNSKGEYIALLDADDIFLPEKLEKQAAYLDVHPECDISYCDLYHFWDGEVDKLLKLDYEYYSGDEVLPNIIRKNFIAPLTMVIRRSVFDRFGMFDEKFRRSEDLEFLVRVLKGGARVYFLNEILAKLRMRREGNLQSFKSQPEMKETTLLILEKLWADLSSEERKRLRLSECLASARLKSAFAYLENGDKENADHYISLTFNDSFGRKLFGLVLRACIAVLPAALLEKLTRWHHLRSQRGSLTEK